MPICYISIRYLPQYLSENRHFSKNKGFLKLIFRLCFLLQFSVEFGARNSQTKIKLLRDCSCSCNCCSDKKPSKINYNLFHKTPVFYLQTDSCFINTIHFNIIVQSSTIESKTNRPLVERKDVSFILAIFPDFPFLSWQRFFQFQYCFQTAHYRAFF